MKTILVVDDMAVFREPIAASLRLAGYETLCAADGEEALRATRAQRPDLILLDVSMPKMDGLTFLKHLRADASIAGTPVILLTALSEKKYVLSAGSLGVKDYLLKSRFRLQDLLGRIKKIDAAVPAAPAPAPATPQTSAAEPCGTKVDAASAPAPAPAVTAATRAGGNNPRLLTRERFLEKVSGILQAKTLSGVVTQVIALATSPRGDLAQLASVIARDPMLSARVLHAANSASYAKAGTVVTTIPEAIRKVGFATVRNVAAAVGVFDCVPAVGADGFNPIGCWQHSFAVAQLCERLVTASSAERAGLAYVVGLCHDLGEIFIRSQFARELQAVVEATARTGRPAEELQLEMLGMTHAQMLADINKCMSLPTAIRDPIEAFHSPNAARSSDPLARVLWMAEHYANGAMLASSPASAVVPLSRSFCLAAAGSENPPRPDPQSFRREVLSLTVALARLSPAEESGLLVPMFPKRTAKVWLARGGTISDFDPVATALDSLAEVRINSRLPIGRETDDIDGLVVLAPKSAASGISQQEIGAATVLLRGTSRKLPVMVITSDAGRTAGDEGAFNRISVPLADLAKFAATIERERGAALDDLAA